MDRDSLKYLIGWGMIVLSMFVLFGTLRGKYGGGPMFSQLMAVFGSLFFVLFLVGQLGLCWWSRSKSAAAWVVGMFVLGFLAGNIGEMRWSAEQKPPPKIQKMINEYEFAGAEYDWTRHKLISGCCLSGIVLGFLAIRGRLSTE